MDQTWVQSRPHLQNLAAKMQAVLEMADALFARGQRDGDAVDYGAFEEEVSRATAELECAVHETALSGLNIDAPFVRVWGKTYRRCIAASATSGPWRGQRACIARSIAKWVAEIHPCLTRSLSASGPSTDGGFREPRARSVI
jgi:hypothetical protein